MSIELLAIPAIALIAIILMLLSRRASAGGARKTQERRAEWIDAGGIRVGDSLATWSSIFEVAVITRRSFRGTWFGLEIMSDDVGPILVDGSDGLVEPFLAESYRLPGFDHDNLAANLAANRSRSVCYRR
ncbi:MAG: hypothetical protein ACR2QO_11975 [Acidimicrobiales bacterium]